MTPEEVNEILEQLRDLTFRAMDGEVAISVDDLLQARRQIQNWNKAGRPGEMPWQDRVATWGLLKGNGSGTSDALPVAAPAMTRAPDLPSPPPAPPVDEWSAVDVAAEPPPAPGFAPTADPDDALQTEFDRGVDLLNKGVYKTARTIFETLAGHARGRLVVAIENRRLEAQEKWAAEVDRLAVEARRYMDRNTADVNGITERWNRVLAQDERHPDALAALERLRRRKTRDATRKEIEAIRSRAKRALEADHLPNLNAAFGDAEGLRDNNVHDDLVEPLVQLVSDIKLQRDKLREKLGVASTLLASNQIQAYRLAREYFNAGTPIIVDTENRMGRGAGAEIETVEFFRKARAEALSYLRQLATQRLDEAGGQQAENPLLARQTLQDAVDRLTDPVLTSDDQPELKPTLEKVNGRLAEVNDRIRKYTDAAAKVAAAAESGLSPADKLRLYAEAKAIYPTYPAIDSYIETATNAVAAVVAAELERQIAQARQHAARDEYPNALTLLAEARQQALVAVPDPRPNSDLASRLEDVRKVEGEIIQAQARYENLMALLRDINALLDAHELDTGSDRLNMARLQLEQLGEREYEKNHRETLKVKGRLASLQTIGENWAQGVDAYRRGNWRQAILSLSKVVASEAPERAEAATLVRRAEAAQLILEARDLSRQHRAREALDKYGEVEIAFKAAGTDETTARLLQDAQTDLNYLKSFKANDAKVEEAIQRAKGFLTQAAMQIEQRRDVLSLRVEPIDNFEKALQALETVRALETTLTQELESTRRRVLEDWRSAYLATMRAVHVSADLGILDSGIALGRTLHERNLLYEADDKNTWRALQERRLELRFQALRQQIPPTLDELKEMEVNRQEFLSLAATPTDELRRAYNEAVARRVLHQIGQLEKPDDAYSLLQQELRANPSLYQNEALFAELIHLCWRRQEWPSVRTQAEQLIYRPHVSEAKTRSNIWLKLNEAAQHLVGDEIRLYEAAIATLQQDNHTSELNDLIVREEKWLVAERVRQLRYAANEALRGDEDDRFIQAAQRYAQAYQLDAGGIEVQEGLKRLSGELAPSLRAVCASARDLRLRNNSLAETLAVGRPLQVTLSALQRVKGVLNLDAVLDKELEISLKALNTRLDIWSQLDQQLNDVEVVKRRALTFPGPLPGDSGWGWSLADPLKALQNVQSKVYGEANPDPDLQKLLKEYKTRLGTLDTTASGLNNQINGFRNVLDKEAFAEVMDMARQLTAEWERAERIGFGGLDELISHDYPHARLTARSLNDHQEMAQRQQSNYEEWLAWAERARKAYEAAQKSARILRRDLQALKEEGRSLKEIGQLSKGILDAAGDFEDVLEHRPKIDPLSRKAIEARAAIGEIWRTEVLDERSGYQAKANDLLKRVEEELGNLERGHLRQLRTAMKQLEDARERLGRRQGFLRGKINTIPGQLFTVAERCLKSCIQIDPLHEDVLRYQRRFTELQEHYAPPQV